MVKPKLKVDCRKEETRKCVVVTVGHNAKSKTDEDVQAGLREENEIAREAAKDKRTSGGCQSGERARDVHGRNAGMERFVFQDAVIHCGPWPFRLKCQIFWEKSCAWVVLWAATLLKTPCVRQGAMCR